MYHAGISLSVTADAVPALPEGAPRPAVRIRLTFRQKTPLVEERGLYLIKDTPAPQRLASPFGRGAPAGGGEGPLSHGRCRASSPRGRAKYSLPNSPDVSQKGNAPLPGGRGRPPLRKVRPFVLLFEVMKFIPKGYHNCQLFIVNCQFLKTSFSPQNTAAPGFPRGLLDRLMA